MPSEKPGFVDLALFAPYNEKVWLTASWNKWERVPLEKSKDGWWRTEVQLEDGEYFYNWIVKSKSYFAIDKEIEVFDPYGLSISNDEKQRTYLRVRDGKRLIHDYVWKHDDVPLPNNQQLILYELHVGDFSGGKGDIASPRVRGKFTGVIEKLDYLKELGINAIELMPVKEFPGKSWGYNLAACSRSTAATAPRPICAGSSTRPTPGAARSSTACSITPTPSTADANRLPILVLPGKPRSARDAVGPEVQLPSLR